MLSLNTEAFLERRLQTLVFKLGLAKSIHHARVLIRQRHIRRARGGTPSAALPPSERSFACADITASPRSAASGSRS